MGKRQPRNSFLTFLLIYASIRVTYKEVFVQRESLTTFKLYTMLSIASSQIKFAFPKSLISKTE